MITFKLVDDCGEGPHRAIVMPEGGGPGIPPILYVNLDQPPTKGSRFTYHDRLWELVEERMAKPGAIEGGDTFWEARAVKQ